MSRIKKVTQTTSKTASVVANCYDAIIETVPLTDAADTEFQFVVNNSVIQDVSAILISTEYSNGNGVTTRTATLTGSSGTANVTVDGVDYLATFATNLTTTAANWVTANAATLLALGFTATSSGAVITISALTTVFTTIAVTNVSGNLAGTLGTQTNTASTGSPIVDLVSYVRGAMTVRVRNYGTASLNTFVRFHFKITHN